MKAKFRGRCRDCGGPIHVGDEINWSKALGARHADPEVCEYHEADYDYRREQEAELRMEGYAEAQLMGYGVRAREEGWF